MSEDDIYTKVDRLVGAAKRELDALALEARLLRKRVAEVEEEDRYTHGYQDGYDKGFRDGAAQENVPEEPSA